MRIITLIVLLISTKFILAQDWIVATMPAMPIASTNNAVCEGVSNDTAYVYSFGGLDTSKKYSGIHQKSFRYNTKSQIWESIPDLPDTLGKIAAAASRVGDTIYIMGGYHVFANQNETSSNKVHRFDTQTNQFISDGANIPRAIDDHVQAVWRDSLIFLITGWSNTTNYPDVQVYNPFNNTWKNGTPVPNNNLYKVFGGSGTIIGDTIYYFGGAKYGTNFPISNSFIKGAISASADTIQIEWSQSVLSTTLAGYRMASITSNNMAFWLGGSEITYNYDGIAYNGSGGVEPANHNIVYYPTTGTWDSSFVVLPMDLRGIAKVSDYEAYIAGGMLLGQEVSDQLYKLKFNWGFLGLRKEYEGVQMIYPNPADTFITIEGFDNQSYAIIDLQGKLIRTGTVEDNKISVQELKGAYFIKIKDNTFKIIAY